ncbi:MAG TPA: 50S ribosomal protein L15 [Candidatus Absconditabacterales bacterium]|nr:50S ribosomal protein L15 [Candidatus Absconditabacterales bacterium]
MKLFEIKKSTGLKKKANRIGRGNATKGNYSGKGLKGQKARSGYSAKPYFEGGQTSVVQRLPKMRGFKRYYKLVDNYYVVNLGNLEKDERVTKDMEITKFKLKELGYIKKEKNLVKILGNGKLTKKLSFKGIEKFSKTATEKIEKAGAKIN